MLEAIPDPEFFLNSPVGKCFPQKNMTGNYRNESLTRHKTNLLKCSCVWVFVTDVKNSATLRTTYFEVLIKCKGGRKCGWDIHSSFSR